MGSLPFLFVAALFFTGPVTMTVYPPFSVSSPASFRARAIIERHADNRRLLVEFDGPEKKSSLYQIDGAQRQRVFETDHRRPWTVRGIGEYTATATLIRMVDGREKKFVSSQVFRVLGPEGIPEF